MTATLAAACLAALLALAGCGDQAGPAPPVAPAAAPDTRSLGAGFGAASCGSSAMPDEALQRINAARAEGRRCGARSLPPVAPLKWDAALDAAAQAHSLDMARRNYFDHRSPEGVSVSQRASASRYNWRSVGENIAGGDSNIAAAMQGWLASADHCQNLMDGSFNDVAVACVQQPGSEWGTYWTMMLGRKR